MGELKFGIFFNPIFEGYFGTRAKGCKSRLKNRALPYMVPGFLIFVTQEAVPALVIKVWASGGLKFMEKR